MLRPIGILLIAAAILGAIILQIWVGLVDVGPEMVIAVHKAPGIEETVSIVQYDVDWGLALPLGLCTLVGVGLVVVSFLRKTH